jgi:hypothetical protein
MGAVVAISNTDGIKLSVADYWLGGFSTLSSLGALFWDMPDNDTQAVVVNKADEQTMIDAGYITYPFSPAISISWFGLVNGDTIGPDSVQATDYSSLPCLMPYHTAEAFWCTATDIVLVDIDLSGTPDQYKVVYDNSLLFYLADGNNLGGRMTYSVQTGSSGRYWRVGQQLTATKQVSFSHVNYDTNGSEMIVFRNVEFPNEEKIYLSTLIPTGTVPDALRSILLDPIGIRSIHPFGSYSFELDGIQTFLHVMNASGTPYIFFGGSAAEDYFNDHPEHEQWKLFYSLKVGATTYVINSSQFMDLLDSLATVDVYASWNDARRMLEQLSDAIPNNYFTVPYDSIMFHSHAGEVYTWTRHYGAVKFTPTGLFSASISVPSEVDATVGVRPEITYAGTYNEVPLYLCICNRVKEEIEAVYYGSPFVAWTKLPGVPDGYTLVHARPVKVTPTEIHLIGVVMRDVEPVYNFAYLKWIPGSVELWKVLGQLPFTVQSDDNFAVCLYGEGQLVKDLAIYQTPPMILPETPVGPYDKYAIGLP